MGLILEVDEQDNRLGLREKEDFYAGKHIHRSVHLILLNAADEMLLQLRAPTKKWYPDLITYSVSGTVDDESYEEAMVREAKEEIGLDVTVERLFKFPFFDDQDKAWRCVFLARSDAPVNPDGREIARIQWVPLTKLREDIVRHPEKYTPPFVAGMKRFFEECYGRR